MHLFVHVSTASCMQCHMDASNCCTKYAGKFATPICHILCLGCYQGMTRFAVRLETQHCKSVPCSLQVKLASSAVKAAADPARLYLRCMPRGIEPHSLHCTSHLGVHCWSGMLPLHICGLCSAAYHDAASVPRLMGFYSTIVLNHRAGFTRWPAQLHWHAFQRL